MERPMLDGLDLILAREGVRLTRRGRMVILGAKWTLGVGAMYLVATIPWGWWLR